MKRIALLAAGILMISTFTACATAGNNETSSNAVTTAAETSSSKASAPGESEAYHKITADEAKEMLDGTDGVTLVDVRTPDEYAESHIDGAVSVPNETIGAGQPDELPDKASPVIVYCRTGVRSKQAADKLVAMGYTAVYDMGGINDWPYGTVSGQ